jgi:hypothetical protein
MFAATTATATATAAADGYSFTLSTHSSDTSQLLTNKMTRTLQHYSAFHTTDVLLLSIVHYSGI